MKWLDGYRIRFVLVGIVVVIVLSSRIAKADFTFGTPTNLGPTINSSYGEAVSSISADGLMLYFASDRSDGYGGADIWVTKRQTIVEDWGAPENLGPSVNTSQDELFSCISSDGLELYFDAHNRPGGYGQGPYAYDIWMAKRQTRNDAWGIPINIETPVNTSGVEGAPRLSTDGLELYFTDYNRAGGYGADDIWLTKRATKNDPWEPPINLGTVVNSSASEDHPFLSADGLALFFSEDQGQPLHPLRLGGFGNVDMWVTTRSNISEPWGTPVNLGPIVNSTSLDGAPVISPDGLTLYFSSERAGGFGGIWGDIYQAPIIPIVDLNGDGIVDSADMCIMVDNWGTAESLCDIGPMPWGDGVVDVQDLIVLADHLFEDYRLVAHWALDETEGIIAYESTGNKDATCHDEPIWQSDLGKVGGALQFDGIDDYVSTPFVLNPGEVSFSATAWIRGGAPGQVIISQADAEEQSAIESGSTWLGIHPSEGRLMTGLMDIFFGPLESESVVADEQWHHVCLVYDYTAMKRHLYVDGAEVAVDAGFVGGVQSTAGLYIGAGQTLDVTSFFSGLIDDVRIYDVALTTEEIAALSQ